MPLADKTCEIEKVLTPLERRPNITPAFHIRLVSLSAQLHSIDGVTLRWKGLSHRPKVTRGSTEAVNTNNDRPRTFRFAGPVFARELFAVPRGPVGERGVHHGSSGVEAGC